MSTGTCGEDDDTSYNTTLCEELIVCEILSRLPAKSLVQFKCVSKRWRSLIQQDPHFIDLHLTRSKTRQGPTTLLIRTFRNDQNQTNFSLVDLFDGGQVEHRLAAPGYVRILEPLNGLICLILHRKGYVCISNISTGEKTPWIKLTINEVEGEEEEKEEENQCNPVNVLRSKKFHLSERQYGFGLDLTTKEYKLICIWDIQCEIQNPQTLRIEKEDVDEVCEIFTVGHNKWRRINDVPQYKIRGLGVYLNGSIYWRTFGYICSEHWKRNNPESYKLQPPYDSGEAIVAFDIGSEKFRVISIPDYTLRQPEADSDQLIDRSRSLIKLNGRIAMTDMINNHTVKLWILTDGDHNDRNSGTSTGYNWIEETISLPLYNPNEERGYSFEPIAGTDKIIMIRHEEKLSALDIYNCKEKTFTKVKFNGVPKDLHSWSSQITTFIESLLLVQ